MPSTRISRFGFAPRIALPAFCAANRQSVVGLPVPHVAPLPLPLYVAPLGLCGSLRRSAPTTVGFPLYRLASITQSLTHWLSEYVPVYHSPFCSALLPFSDRWLSRITFSPIEPAYPITLSMMSSVCS